MFPINFIFAKIILFLEKPLIHKKCLLEKFPGKGGWTYTTLPGSIKKKEHAWKKIRGFIDDFEIRKYTLMPRKDGSFLLPVKQEICKKIHKKEGDTITVILYTDDEPLKIPEDLLLCLEDETEASLFFNNLSESEQKFYVEWIYSAKREETKIERMAKTINRLNRGLKLYAKEEA